MTVNQQAPRTVSFSVNARMGAGYRFSGEVNVEKFLPVYRALRDYLDVDPARPPLRYAVRVYKELLDAGWEEAEAKHYAHAARLACAENLDPVTGEPLAGIAAVHRVYVETAVSEIGNILSDQMPDTLLPDEENMAWRIVERLADLGWAPAS